MKHTLPLSDITVGSRFFFFSTLLNSPDKYANAMGNIASRIINNGLPMIQQKDNFSQESGKIETALDFLKAAAEHAREKERNFFEKMIDSSKANDRLYKELKACYTGDTFDYKRVIKVINELMLGEEQFKKQLINEQKRLQVTEQLSKDYSAAKQENEKINLFESFRNTVLTHNAASEDKWSTDIGSYATISNKLQDKIESSIKRVFNEISIEELLSSTGMDAILYNREINQVQIRRALKFILMQEFIKETQKSTQELADLTTTKFTEEMINAAKKIEGNAKFTNPTPILQEMLEHQSHLELFARNFSNGKEFGLGSKGISDDLTNITGLTKDMINKLKGTISILKRNGVVEYNGSNQLLNRNGVVQQIVTALRKQGHTIQTNLDLVNILNSIIDDNSIHIGKRFNPEYQAANSISDAAILFGQKAMTTIMLNYINGVKGDKDDSRTVLGQLGIDINVEAQEIIKHCFGEYIFKMQQMREQLFSKVAGTDKMKVSAQDSAFQNLIKYEKELLASFQKKLSNSEYQALLNMIESSVTIETSTKSYNSQYSNISGFHGGGLGANKQTGNLTKQIANINKMLELGGVTVADADWLMFATLNAGAGLIGEKIHDNLEYYFSTAAGMLMFDDSAKIAREIADNRKNNVNFSNNTIQLYYLNDFYYPQSVLLQRTYDELRKAMFTVQGELEANISKGVAAHIENNVSYNKESDGDLSMQEFYNAHKNDVNITVTFLAGLLDIFDEIRNMDNLL